MDRRAFLAAAAAAPFAVAATQGFARARGGTPLALVTADLESHVVPVELATGRLRKPIATLAGPRSIETVGNGTTALAVHTTLGAISLIDVATLRVRAVLHDFVEPRYSAGGPDGRFAYVTDAGSGEVVTIDVAGGRIVHRTRVGAHARHLSLDPLSSTLWTALGFSAPAIVAVDISTPGRPRVVRRIVPPFAAHDVVFAPEGGRAWISSGNENRLAVYDASSRRVLFELPAGKPPQHIAFTAGRVYVTSDDALRVHRLDDGKLLRTTAVPDGSYNVTQGWGRVLTPSLDRGTLTVLDQRGRLLSRRTVARAAHDACFVVTA